MTIFIRIQGRTLTIALLLLVLVSSCSPKAFTLALLPDTQTYSQKHPEIFMAQTEWIAKNADSITFVLHQGDITNNNNDEQWQRATAAFHKLDNKVPYTFAVGNHDMGDPGSNAEVRVTDRFNEYMPYDKYSKMEHFGGSFTPGKMDNTWHTFKAGGLDWLILTLEFGPRNKVLDWAGEIISSHPRHKVIINTHAYMYSDDTRISHAEGDYWAPQAYGVGKNYSGEDAANDGEMIWEKLVSQHSNVLLVFNGHILNDGTGKLVSTGVHGNKVYQMLANYQGGVKRSVNGGNGFLRLININPARKEISIETYSPHTDEHKTEEDQQFTFKDVQF